MFSFHSQEFNYVDNVEFDYWVEIRDVIGSGTHFITFHIFVKLAQFGFVFSSSVPDPAKNETGQLSNYWDNNCNNIESDPTDVIAEIANFEVEVLINSLAFDK